MQLDDIEQATNDLKVKGRCSDEEAANIISSFPLVLKLGIQYKTGSHLRLLVG